MGPSTPTRDWTLTPRNGSVDSQPLYCQGSPSRSLIESTCKVSCAVCSDTVTGSRVRSRPLWGAIVLFMISYYENLCINRKEREPRNKPRCPCICKIAAFHWGVGGSPTYGPGTTGYWHGKKVKSVSCLTPCMEKSSWNKDLNTKKPNYRSLRRKYRRENIFMTLGLGRLSYRRLQSTDNKQKDQDKKITLQNCLPKAPPGKPT